jgi:hypothetical protein
MAIATSRKQADLVAAARGSRYSPARDRSSFTLLGTDMDLRQRE